MKEIQKIFEMKIKNFSKGLFFFHNKIYFFSMKWEFFRFQVRDVQWCPQLKPFQPSCCFCQIQIKKFKKVFIIFRIFSFEIVVRRRKDFDFAAPIVCPLFYVYCMEIVNHRPNFPRKTHLSC